MGLADFKIFEILWRYLDVNKKDEYNIDLVCIISELLYGLQISWLIKA